MTAQAIQHELEAASRGLKRCSCGSKAVMKYEPGCTFIHCLKENATVLAAPDWCPTELAEKWNDLAHTQKERVRRFNNTENK